MCILKHLKVIDSNKKEITSFTNRLDETKLLAAKEIKERN